MRKFTFFLSMLLAMTVMAQNSGYEVNFTGTKGSDRPLNYIKVESQSYGTSNYDLSSSEKIQLYVDATESVTLRVGAGDIVTPSVGYGGSWMHAYVYVDANGDAAFTAGVADDGYTPTGDLVSYSAYNPDEASHWRNSAGERNGNNTVALPTFKAPETVGTYRMRFKIDWNSIDPAGCDDPSNLISTNRGSIIDVTLEVAEPQEGYVEQLFNAATITEGEFAKGTAWYTLQIAGNGFVIADNGTADHIALEEYIADCTDNAQLWAFVGDNTNGYRLYNKNTGTAKVLAAPTTMKGTTGSASYPILVDATAVPAGYTDMWMFTSSSDLGSGDNYFYMYEKGYPANKVNNRDYKLAFWNGGADAGSTLNIQLGQVEYPVTTSTGEWTASNAAGTWAAGWKSTAVPHAMLQETQGRNNIAGYNDNGDLQLYTCLENATVNGVYIATYAISTDDDDYMIAGYSFDFVSSGTNDITVTPYGGEAVTAGSATAANVSVVNSEESTLLTFDVTSTSNMFANTSNFYITLVRKAPVVEPATDIFVTKTNTIPYRIPAIAMAKNGDLIAVADYRHSGADIGVVNNGRIDLLARISKDNGATWGDKFAIVEGQGANSPDFMHVGFGDPAIVADRESDRVLVLSCAGNVSFQSGTRNNHQNIARFYSEDNGATWSEPVDIAESIYSMWDNSSQGPVMAMFVGSGKIHQSRYVKVNDYYRLYCAVLLKNKNGTYTNFVLYSDDFGGSWDVLGGVETAPIPSGGDEPKVEELPNGNVVISSRIYGGRDFNIFTFTDKEQAQGSWGTRATSNANNNGVIALGNSTNGEILIFPAVRNEDNAKVWMALQSVPFGSGRTNVGIYYKELASETDYNTPANFAKDWDGRHQASFLGSAYSTMCFQQDSTIAFLYEEETYGAGYTIVYKNYTLEQITDGAYSISNHTTVPEPEPEPEQPVSNLVLNLTAEQIGTTYPYQLNDEEAAKIFALNDITVAVKFNTSSLGGRKALFATADPTQAANTDAMGTNSYYVAYGMNNADLGYLASWRDGDRYTAGNCIPANAEDNVAVFVINPTNNNFRSYINGLNIADRNFGTYEIASPAMVKADYPDANIYIGGAEHAGGYGEVFNGTITGVKVFEGALTADEIAAINFDAVEPEPEPAGPVVITSVDQLSNAKLYTITSSDAGRGNFYALDSKVDMCAVTYNAGADACHSVAYNAEDPKQQFAFVNYEGKFYIYSVSEKKFLAKDGNVNKLTAEAPYDYVTVEKVIEAGENTFALMANDAHYFTASPGWCSNASRNTCIQSTLTSHSSSDGWDAGAWFIITEVGDFDATEALAMLTPAEPEVEPLEVVSITPANGETVEKLEQVVVTFSAPVTLDETKNISLVAVEESNVTPIEAYAGSWNMVSEYPGYDEYTYYATGTIEVIDFNGEPALLCKNFADYAPEFGYDDSFIMLYNSEDGSVTLPAQQVGDFYYEGVTYKSAILLANSMKMELFNGKLIGNIVDGNIVFENSAENEGVADSFMYYAEELGTLSYFNSLTWTPAEAAAAPAKAARNRIAVEGVKKINVAPIAKNKINRADENVVNVVSASINPDDATQLIITVNEALANGTYKLSIEAGAVVTAEGATNEAIICTYYLNVPTGIDELETENGEIKTIYDLTGRKVETITARGIYIVNGKKVLVK